MSQQECPPVSFYDFGGRHIVVIGELSYNRFKCPRCGQSQTTEVFTTDGIYLYCFGCCIFYPEFGNWGYKK